MAEGILFSWVSVYRFRAKPICLRLLRQATRLPFSLALERTGRSIAARIAIMAMTTRSSIKVKAAFGFRISALAMKDRAARKVLALRLEAAEFWRRRIRLMTIMIPICTAKQSHKLKLGERGIWIDLAVYYLLCS